MKIIALMPIILPALCFGYDEERAMNNLAHDYAICSAYYALMSEGSKKSGKEIEGMLDLSFKAFQMSVELTNQKLTTARVELSVKDMKEDMDNNWSNASIVINKYAYFCRDLFDKPEERMKYWLDKKQ